jgi:hypothetical protein
VHPSVVGPDLLRSALPSAARWLAPAIDELTHARRSALAGDAVRSRRTLAQAIAGRRTRVVIANERQLAAAEARSRAQC